MYVSRIDFLSRIPGVDWVAVFKNHGRDAGASLFHSHSQVAAIGITPLAVAEEVSACKRFGSCAYCRIIDIEKGSLRKCFENNSFVAFAPYASRFNYEIWIFPKKHITAFTDIDSSGLGELADILKRVLDKLKSINAPYNFVLHYSGVHAHIEITPRLAHWAGFEFASGIIINSVSPEDAASFYRGEE